MLLAIFVPFGRAMLDGNGTSGVVFLIIQSAMAAGCGYWVAKKRAHSLQLGGAKLGSGFCGVIRWKHWPKVVSWLAMLLIASFQLSLAILFASYPMLFIGSIQLWISQGQLAFFTSRAFLCFFSRVYPNSIEFFEHGIVLYGTLFLPWEQVSVRQSTLYPDRIVVVCQMKADMQSGNLSVVQVADELRQSVFAVAVTPAKLSQASSRKPPNLRV